MLIILPQVQVFDLRGLTFTDNDVLIMATDGLWDVTTNTRAVEIVRAEINKSKGDDKQKYVVLWLCCRMTYLCFDSKFLCHLKKQHIGVTFVSCLLTRTLTLSFWVDTKLGVHVSCNETKFRVKKHLKKLVTLPTVAQFGSYCSLFIFTL